MSLIKVRKKTRGEKPTRHFSKNQEDHVAKALGGKRTPNSGATFNIKGDVTLGDWLIECKTTMTEKKSFSIKREWLIKNLNESSFMGKKYSALAFNFEPGGTNYYIIDENTFKEILGI